MDSRQLCTFRLDKLHLAVNVRRVRGILAHQPLTPVPLAPPAVRGLMNLRGEIIAGIDLRPCLGLASLHPDRWTNIVLGNDTGPVSLLVDEIGEVTTIDDGQLETPPETLDAQLRDITEAVFGHNGKLTLLLDVDRVVQLGSRAAVGVRT